MTTSSISRIRRAAAQRDDADQRLRDAVVAAVRAGEQVAECAREAGVSRPTVYRWVQEADPDLLPRKS